MKKVSSTGDYTLHAATKGQDEIMNLSNAFNDLMRQVSENQEKKDEFIGIASHKLKTPLTSIKAYLQIIDSIEQQQPQKQYISKTLESVNKLQQLIYDLLDVSKIQSGQLHLNKTDFDIDTLTDETLAAYRMVVPGYVIERINGKLNAIVHADRHRIEQVIINLLSNSVKYSPGANKVIVSVKESDQEVIIKVRDFGIGINPEEHDKIIERFYRASSNSILISGFGLGLYICRDIIRRHKGKTWVESERPGTSVCFSLPIERKQNAS